MLSSLTAPDHNVARLDAAYTANAMRDPRKPAAKMMRHLMVSAAPAVSMATINERAMRPTIMD